MEFFSSLFNKGYKELKNKEDIYQLIPQQVLKYFPIAPGIREEEFEYVSSKLLNLYRHYLNSIYDKNRFMVMVSDGIYVDLMSISEDTIEKVKRIKRRNEMDIFLEQYQFDHKIIEHLEQKPANIDFLFMKYSIERLKLRKIGSLKNNFTKYTLEFRTYQMVFLLNLIPQFNYGNICELCQQLESFNNDDFWNAYEEYWIEFGYDEHFTPWEYMRAFEYLDEHYNRSAKRLHYSLTLLRLTKRDILSNNSYSGIDGVYYFLCVADCAIHNKKHLKWIIEGLKWYGNRKEIESFCRTNGFQFPLNNKF